MESFDKLLTDFHIAAIIRAVFIIIIGLITSKLLSSSISRAAKNRLRPHQVMLLRRISFYVIFILFLFTAVQQFGFNLSALLGATGILTVALGIASQTSMSNIISGIFIIAEKPFEIGDTIKVNDLQGEVLSIDFLSVKIRTSNNTMIRIPNETLIKSAVNNVSYFPLRRVELILGIASNEDLDKVKNILCNLTEKNPLCLDDPKPYFGVDGFGECTVNIQFRPRFVPIHLQL